MGSAIRVAEVSELPPGKGKVIELHGRQVTIFNLEGRYYATSTRCEHEGPMHAPHAEPAGACSQHGLAFDVSAEDSPARLNADEQHCRVRVEGAVIYVEF